MPAEGPAAAAAEWAPPLSCCQSHPCARPRSTEPAATGSLGTGTEAGGGDTALAVCFFFVFFLNIDFFIVSDVSRLLTLRNVNINQKNNIYIKNC